MKKYYSLAIALLFATGLMAQFNVTFRVDMTGQTVNANGVHIAGSFQNPAWQPGSTSMSLSTGSIYTVTVSVPAGVYEFKFLNGNTWGDVESVPAVAQVDLGQGNDNRWINVISDTTLPALMYSGAAPAGRKAIALVVDMSLEANIADTVSAAGSGWSPAWTPGHHVMTDLKGDSIYRMMGYPLTGSTAEWKFINGTDWAQAENVPASCAQGGNRFAVMNNDTIYGPVCFGACASCFIPDTFNITFRVDAQNICGNVDSMDLAGPFNSWSGGDYLDDSDGDGVWELTKAMAAGDIEYKARYFEGGNAIWEGGGNRIAKLTKDTVLPIRCYGEEMYVACSTQPNPSDITFMVDVSTFPTPADLNDVYLIGDFTNPAWQSGKILMTPVTGQPGVFETTVTGICPGKIAFKFMNVTTANVEQEEGFPALVDSSCTEPSGTGGLNRFYVRPDDQPQTIGFKYDQCTSIVGLEENTLSRLKIYPNPFSTSTTVELEENEDYTLKMYDITGKVIWEMDNVSGKIQIDRGILKTGIYSLHINDNKGNTTSHKLIIR